MAQPGSASALGAEGREFESLCPDQELESRMIYIVLEERAGSPDSFKWEPVPGKKPDSAAL